MKKSIMRGVLPLQQSVVKILDPIKKAGFDGIQLGVLQPPFGELSVRTTDAAVKALARNLRDAGLEPHSIYLGVQFFYADADRRKQAHEEGKRVIEIAHLLGARTWLIHPGRLTPEIPYDDCWKFALDGLNALKRQAEGTHLRIGLENVWNMFLMSPLEARRLVEEVTSPAVGIWFDIGNVVAFGYPEQWLRILGKKHLVGIHVKDFRRDSRNIFGTFEGFVPVFHGSVNWPAVMRQLADLDFNDYLVTESAPGRQPLPEALKELARHLDVLLGMVSKSP